MTLPPIHDIEHIIFPEPEIFRLNNGIPVYGFNGAKNDILRIDLIFDAGKWTEELPLQADFTASLFKSGTSKMTSFEINEAIECLGSSIRVGAGYNSFTVSIFGMNKYLKETMEYAMSCLNDTLFPEKELDLQQQKALANLSVSLEKNEYLADTRFRSQIYGSQHPYGYITTADSIRQLKREHLLNYYQRELVPAKCSVFIAGNYGDAERQLLDATLGQWTKTATQQESSSQLQTEFADFSREAVRIRREKSVQASIVIGYPLFNKHHEDYAAFILLNTIFGGYFGSRLMSNIREDKGLTYGIHSSLFSLRHSGMYTIQTETNLENVDLCLREIYDEMQRLQQDLIPEEEIRLARNYLLGKFLSRTDGPFNRAETYKGYFIENVNMHKFSTIVESIRATDAVSLQQLAQRYLQKVQMLEVVVG